MSDRFKITVGLVAVLLLGYVVGAVKLAGYFSDACRTQAHARARGALSVLTASYRKRARDVEDFLRGCAARVGIGIPLAADVQERFTRAVRRARLPFALDVCGIIDLEGDALVRVRGRGVNEISLAPSTLRACAAADGVVVRGTLPVILEAPAVGGERARRRPLGAVADADALGVGAVIALRDEAGSITGYLWGATVLEEAGTLAALLEGDLGRELGSEVWLIGIFQESAPAVTTWSASDVTNGQELQAAGLAAVLGGKDQWVGDAGDTVLACGPLTAPGGAIVGGLCVRQERGVLSRFERVVLFGAVGLVVVTVVAALGLLTVHYRSVRRPVRSIRAMCQRVIDGDDNARVKHHFHGDLGALAGKVNLMVDAVARRQRLSREIAREQYGFTEKLASIGRLAAGIAHEVNNPLTGVLTFAHRLGEQSNITDTQREDLAVIANETNRVGEIVRGLLDFARETPSENEAVDLNAIIQRTVRLLRSQRGFQHITICEELDTKLPRVWGDRNKLEQVYLNLGINACEAMAEGGTLRFCTRSRTGTVVSTVEDTGHGIRDEDLVRIFDPFFTTKPVGKGTGLGLSVTYGIVKQHKGSIRVESRENEGARFTVRIPAWSGTGPPETTPAAS